MFVPELLFSGPNWNSVLIFRIQITQMSKESTIQKPPSINRSQATLINWSLGLNPPEGKYRKFPSMAFTHEYFFSCFLPPSAQIMFAKRSFISTRWIGFSCRICRTYTYHGIVLTTTTTTTTTTIDGDVELIRVEEDKKKKQWNNGAIRPLPIFVWIIYSFLMLVGKKIYGGAISTPRWKQL